MVISQTLGSGFTPPQKGSAHYISTVNFTHIHTHRVTRLASALTHVAHNAAGGQNTQRCTPKATTVLAHLTPAAQAARLPRGREGVPRRPQPGVHACAIPASSRRAGAPGRPPRTRPATQQAHRTAARTPTGEGGRQLFPREQPGLS